MFHRRPLDTIWHRLPIRHVSFKRRKQSMKDTRKIERSPRFPPPPLWWVLLFGCGVFFLRFVLPDVHSRNRGGSCRQTASPRPYLRCPGPPRGLSAAPGPGSLPSCPAPERRSAEPAQGSAPTARAAPRAGRPLLPPGRAFGVFSFYFSLGKALNGEISGAPWPLSRLRPVLGGAALARVRCGDTLVPGAGGPVALWGPVVALSRGVGVSAVSAGQRGPWAGECAAGGPREPSPKSQPKGSGAERARLARAGDAGVRGQQRQAGT